MKKNLFITTLALVSTILISCSTTRQEKTVIIIHNLDLIEPQKQNYTFQIEALKYWLSEEDIIKIAALEKQLSYEEIEKKICTAFDKTFSNNEINDIYRFTQSEAFEKIAKSLTIYHAIDNEFKDINQTIEDLRSNYTIPTDTNTINSPQTKHLKQIPIDREDGFYETIDYNPSGKDEDIKLKPEPALTTKDILKTTKVFNSFNDQAEIEIVLTKEGTRKFHILTQQNIGKPIAIVIAKQIVALPTVSTAIGNGRVSINGNISEEELDKMIEILTQKE